MAMASDAGSVQIGGFEAQYRHLVAEGFQPVVGKSKRSRVQSDVPKANCMIPNDPSLDSTLLHGMSL